ncbi:hypothetical protein D3C81_1653820 [compost metagenome]
MLQGAERITPLTRISHIDREACQPLNGLPDVFTADCAGDDRLHIGDVQPIAGSSFAVDIHVDVTATG